MVPVVRLCLVLVLCVTLAGCTGSTPPPDVGSSSGSRAATTPSGSAPEAGALPWPDAPTSTLPQEGSEKMLAEMQRWVDKELMPGVTAAMVSPRGRWTAAA